MNETIESEQSLTWSTHIAMLQNRHVLRQTLSSIGVPALLIIIAMWLLADNALFIRVGIALIGLLLVLHVLFFATIYRWHYQARFRLDTLGVHGQSTNEEPEAIWLGKLAAGLIGLFSGKLAYVGAGLLMPGKPEFTINWTQVSRIHYDPTNQTILIHSGLVDRLLIICTKDNYHNVVDLIDVYHD